MCVYDVNKIVHIALLLLHNNIPSLFILDLLLLYSIVHNVHCVYVCVGECVCAEYIA